MPTPLLVQSLALLSAPLAGAAGLLGLRLRRSAGAGEGRESGLRERLAALQSRCEELELLAARDPLTGVWNYRHLQITLEREIERCARPPAAGSGPGSLAVVLLEITGFDAVNAEHGRSRGDVMLRELAQRLSVEIRRSDTLGRYGGTEFLVVLPDTAAAGAVKVAERLCWSVRRHQLLDRTPELWEPARTVRQGNGLTAAAGIAVLPADGAHTAPLLRAADRALASAKRQIPQGVHGNLSACAGSGPASLTGRAARKVAVVAVADEVRS
ncbi:diguanylate cyclase (GGDEF)-like protein [Kitasatospora sp. MAP12-15]|uniref:GGDEF domain-containing protein n=1 Tax=unclassified Kitasatospora TaxID=2633591 RepID=UPI0024741E58|nr:GGDEF domain-containing protein [Kitasatospora sp. MAP12-44]MDH6112433.1 diguanylate cyclase (GGDEF)-like protein [Kitasatospora sp. MAP12-44]